MARGIVLGIRLTAEEHAALAQAAEADERSMSALGAQIIVRWLRARGYASEVANPASHRRPRAKSKTKAAPSSLRRQARRST